MEQIELRTGAWRGDRVVTLPVPTSWHVQVLAGNPPSALSPAEIEKQLQSPIASPKLSEFAQGKRSAVVVIDDIMRPTPTAQLLPLVIAELEQGGIAKQHITILIASGSHPKGTPEDITLKVGSELAGSVRIEHHDDSAELVSLGVTSHGTPVLVNRTVAEADLKVGIGGIYPHPSAGFSGGAKIFAPGVCGRKTITYLHSAVAPGKPGVLGNSFRSELETIAHMIGLDFIVNVTLTPNREIAGVFAGDSVLAHKAGCSTLPAQYGIVPPAKADVVIANCYPFDGSAYFFERGLWALAIAPSNATKILVADGSMTEASYPFSSLGHHAASGVWQIRFRLLLSIAKLWYNPRKAWQRLQELLFLRRGDFWLYVTGAAHIPDLQREFPNAFITNNWEDILHKLQNRYPEQPTVAVYPYAGLTFVHKKTTE